jgi:hypothetical protein
MNKLMTTLMAVNAMDASRTPEEEQRSIFEQAKMLHEIAADVYFGLVKGMDTPIRGLQEPSLKRFLHGHGLKW